MNASHSQPIDRDYVQEFDKFIAFFGTLSCQPSQTF
jgi:hypothetical protein